jgi:hypothetical protein
MLISLTIQFDLVYLHEISSFNKTLFETLDQDRNNQNVFLLYFDSDNQMTITGKKPIHENILMTYFF